MAGRVTEASVDSKCDFYLSQEAKTRLSFVGLGSRPTSSSSCASGRGVSFNPAVSTFRRISPGRDDDGTVKFRFENKNALSDDLAFLATMSEVCDITFVVGDDKQPVCGVKAILAARSRSALVSFLV